MFTISSSLFFTIGRPLDFPQIYFSLCLGYSNWVLDEYYAQYYRFNATQIATPHNLIRILYE